MKPLSIEELKAHCEEKGVPYRHMRFFIGENSLEAKCFGIYHDEETDEYVVYKNKADSSRYERYRGKDEAHAAAIFYDKMMEEVNKRRAARLNPEQSRAVKNNNKAVKTAAAGVIALCAVGAAAGGWYLGHTMRAGYYMDPDTQEVFYHANRSDDSWYYWNDYTGGWDYWEYEDEPLTYYGSTYDGYDTGEEWIPFEDTSEYQEYYEDDSSYDDYDDDWSSDDFDDWDSGDTDWDSDW